MHIGQAKITTTVTIRQLLVIDAHQVQNRRVQIMDVNFVFRRVPAEFVRRAVNVAATDSAAGEEHGEAVMVVVAAGDRTAVCAGLR